MNSKLFITLYEELKNFYILKNKNMNNSNSIRINENESKENKKGVQIKINRLHF